MYRRALDELTAWTDEHNRKPLVLRGARQVGKTWLVRELGRTRFEHLLEVNFDRYPHKADLVSPDIEQTLRYLSADAGVPVEEGKTLLLLDEVQAAPQVLHALRYFYEMRPELHVIAAGSLLDFVLHDHEFAMPVGRVSYYHLGPMSFEEFLHAHGESGLCELLGASDTLPASIHERLLGYVRRFYTVGGMPSVVRASAEGADDATTRLEQEDLLQTYRDDFSKYARTVDVALLRRMFDRLPAQVGRKLKFVNLDRDVPAAKVSAHLQQLVHARLAFPVHHSAGNGPPLGAEADPRAFKLLHLDIGLLMAQLGRPVRVGAPLEEALWVNEGQLAEQFVGQHLLYRQSGRLAPDLYCWLREAKSSNAEVDYLVSVDGEVVPVEVKAGTGGSLKSLHVFCRTKQSPRAVRFHTGRAARERIAASVPIPGTTEHHFELLSLPLYDVGQLDRILDTGGP